VKLEKEALAGDWEATPQKVYQQLHALQTNIQPAKVSGTVAV